jgi:hypothetical protein
VQIAIIIVHGTTAAVCCEAGDEKEEKKGVSSGIRHTNGLLSKREEAGWNF